MNSMNIKHQFLLRIHNFFFERYLYIVNHLIYRKTLEKKIGWRSIHLKSYHYKNILHKFMHSISGMLKCIEHIAIGIFMCVHMYMGFVRIFFLSSNGFFKSTAMASLTCVIVCLNDFECASTWKTHSYLGNEHVAMVVSPSVQLKMHDKKKANAIYLYVFTVVMCMYITAYQFSCLSNMTLWCICVLPKPQPCSHIAIAGFFLSKALHDITYLPNAFFITPANF